MLAQRTAILGAPFLVEGVIIGVMGSIIPIVLVIYGYYRLYQMTGGVLAGVFDLIPVLPFVVYLGLSLFAIGIVVGFLGSYISVCKYLRLTR